jgi:hypothetical protein
MVSASWPLSSAAIRRHRCGNTLVGRRWHWPRRDFTGCGAGDVEQCGACWRGRPLKNPLTPCRGRRVISASALHSVRHAYSPA